MRLVVEGRNGDADARNARHCRLSPPTTMLLRPRRPRRPPSSPLSRYPLFHPIRILFGCSFENHFRHNQHQTRKKWSPHAGPARARFWPSNTEDNDIN
jgi:hypothetical protein